MDTKDNRSYVLSEYLDEIVSRRSDPIIFEFNISKDDIMNSNGIGYAKSVKQQAFLNHKRNEQRKRLVALGEELGNKQKPDVPFEKVFVDVQCNNMTNIRFDPPNLEPTEKHLFDGLVKAGIVVDDNSNYVVGTLFRDGHNKSRDNYSIIISVYPLA